MIRIENVENKDEKTRVTLEIMNALPEWFSPPEDIERKSKIHREYAFFFIRTVEFLGQTFLLLLFWERKE